jgi:hypothetical protein
MDTFYPIEHDGTGFSGTTCEVLVKRLRPLLPSNPQAGKVRKTERCGDLAAWWATDDSSAYGKRLFCGKHKRQVENPPKQRRTSALDRYNAAVSRDAAAFTALQRDAQVTGFLKELLK